MTLVSTVEVGAGGAASIDFTSIPQTGTDLLVVLSTRNSTDGDHYSGLRLNGNTTTANYTTRTLRGTGSVANSFTTTAINSVEFVHNSTDESSSNFSNSSIYIPNYTASIDKSISIDSLYENNGTAANQRIIAGKVAITTAITSIQIVTFGANFAQYSTASLYTILATGGSGATVS